METKAIPFCAICERTLDDKQAQQVVLFREADIYKLKCIKCYKEEITNETKRLIKHKLNQAIENSKKFSGNILPLDLGVLMIHAKEHNQLPYLMQLVKEANIPNEEIDKALKRSRGEKGN